MKRDKKKQAIRQQIINTAYTLMTKQGIKKTGMRQVAQESGISAVTIYKYFSTKDDLVDTVGLKAYQEHIEKSLNFATNPDLSFFDKLKAFSDYSQELQRVYPPKIGAEFYELFTHSPVIKKYISNWQDEFWNGIIRSGRKSGDISDAVSDDAIRAYAQMFVDYLTSHPQQPENLMAQMELLFRYGIVGKR